MGTPFVKFIFNLSMSIFLISVINRSSDFPLLSSKIIKVKNIK